HYHPTSSLTCGTRSTRDPTSICGRGASGGRARPDRLSQTAVRPALLAPGHVGGHPVTNVPDPASVDLDACEDDVEDRRVRLHDPELAGHNDDLEPVFDSQGRQLPALCFRR